MVSGVAVMDDTGSYTCDSCGEEISLAIDVAGGWQQEFAEDCPVCCRPNLIRVEINEDGQVRVWATSE